MTGITEAVSARLHAAGAIAHAQDLYAGSGPDFYDRLVGSDRAEIREVLALARMTAGRVLDLAAGSGRLTIPLVRSGTSVTALDLSEDMLMRLRNALPGDPRLECVVADIRDFSLGRPYDLIVLGATSITLLDRGGRSRLYASVRRHLATGGVFAMSVASGASAESLRTATDREIAVPGPDGDEIYVFSQQPDGEGTVRLVNWVRVADIATGRGVRVLTSRLHVLDAETLARELVDAGFTAPAVSPVRTQGGVDMVLLTTSAARVPTAERPR